MGHHMPLKAATKRCRMRFWMRRDGPKKRVPHAFAWEQPGAALVRRTPFSTF